MEKTIGTKTINTTNAKPRESEEAKALRQNKKTLRKQLKHAIKKKSSNKSTLLEEYITAQKLLKEQIEKDIQDQTIRTANKLIQGGGTKSQLFWKIRKKVLPQKTENTYDVITEENKTIIDPTESREHIANLYEDLYQARRGKPEYQQWTNTITQTVNRLDDQTQQTEPPEKVTMNELNKTIKLLKNNKAPGPDKIPNEIFTHADNTTKEIYLQAINKIIENYSLKQEK